jgi:hypothetical protein
MKEHGVDFALYHAVRNEWPYERPLNALLATWKGLPIGATLIDMKNKKQNTGKPKSDEYATFESALKKVLSVSREEIQKRIKNAASRRASGDKG